MARNVIAHYRAQSADLPEDTRADINLRYLSAQLTTDQSRNAVPLSVGRPVARRLDLEDVVSGPYDLEVSSPGVERPLRQPKEFRRHTGEKVKVRSVEPVDGSRTHTGTLEAADDEGIVVRTEAGERRLRYEDVASARTVFEWGPAERSVKR